MSEGRSTVQNPKIKAALKKIAAYNKAGRFHEVIKAANKTVSENTLRSWLADSKKAFEAYKISKIIDIAEKLEPIGDRRGTAYALAIVELNTNRVEQERLEKFKREYDVFHDLPNNYSSDFDKIGFAAKENYWFFWTKFTTGGAKRFCDGFLFIRDNKMMLAGTSKTNSIFGSLNISENETILGTFILEDHRLNKTFSSKISMHPHGLPRNDKLFDTLMTFPMRSGYEI